MRLSSRLPSRLDQREIGGVTRSQRIERFVYILVEAPRRGDASLCICVIRRWCARRASATEFEAMTEQELEAQFCSLSSLVSYYS